MTEPNPTSGPSMSVSASQTVPNQKSTDPAVRNSSASGGRSSSGKKKDVSRHLPLSSAKSSLLVSQENQSSMLLSWCRCEQQLSQIEKSVTHLLIATKQLLETLTRWSRHNATEGEVSDVYVRLGYEFNIACRAFQSIGVDVSDLGPVPDLLRQILEDTLSQEASQTSLDRYLPRIRDIIINLLHGLKKKQQKLRAKQNKDAAMMLGSRQLSSASTSTNGTVDTSLTDMLEGVPSRFASNSSITKPADRRVGSSGSLGEDTTVPARTSSSQHAYSLSREEPKIDGSPRGSMRERKPPPPSLSDSSMSSATMQNIPVMTPDEYKLPIQRMSVQEELPPPPPPPKQQDALLALQRGGELERRASRRYSAYQISKHLGASPAGVPMLPTQNSPIPNRGRDLRDSLNAVRTRSSLVPGRSRSTRLRESPSRAANVSKRISEEVEQNEQPMIDTKVPAPALEDDSPLAKTPEDMLRSSFVDSSGAERPAVSATLRGPPPDEFTPRYGAPQATKPKPSAEPEKMPVVEERRDSVENQQFNPDMSPQPGKELTLFLQYKTKIKKFVLPEGSDELSIARIQLAFIEKFAWNVHNNGVDLPEIYIQDQVSGVRHELEDLTDVKDRSVLVLNLEPLDEVKRHFDDGLGGLQRTIEQLRTAMEDQKLSITQFSKQQDAATKEVARIATQPPSAPSRSGPAQVNGVRPITATDAQKAELKSLRHDLAVIRQTWGDFQSNMTSSMTAIRAKAQTVKSKAIEVTIPALDSESGRAYVNAGKRSLGDESDALVNKVDELQDTVEDLRKDVVNRGVRTLPRQLDQVNKDISVISKEVKKMQDYIARESPIWSKIWEQELAAICLDREFLTVQGDLGADLDEDMKKLIETVSLVEQATKEQNAQANERPGVNLRSTSRGLNFDTADVNPLKAKDGVLGAVRALQPNHADRLEAIERAEKAHKRELESRREHVAFKRELNKFVEEGKLKKSGGIEETEKSRKQKNERALKEEWESQSARKAARAQARAEERARQEKAQIMAANGELPIEEGGEDGNVEGEAHGEGILDENTVDGANEGSETPPAVPDKDDLEKSGEPSLPVLPKIEEEPGESM